MRISSRLRYLMARACPVGPSNLTDPRYKTLEAIQAAFEKAGVVFLETGDIRDGGAGLRFAKKGRRPSA